MEVVSIIIIIIIIDRRQNISVVLFSKRGWNKISLYFFPLLFRYVNRICSFQFIFTLLYFIFNLFLLLISPFFFLYDCPLEYDNLVFYIFDI